jgi:RAD50-interacting protein 1
LEDNLAGPMSHADIKGSTSASVGSDEDGALFDETIKAYKKRRDHAEGLIVEALKYAFPSTLRPYFNKPQWLTVDDESDNSKSRSLSLDFQN